MSASSDQPDKKISFSELDLAPAWAQGPRTAVGGDGQDRRAPVRSTRPGDDGRNRPPRRTRPPRSAEFAQPSRSRSDRPDHAPYLSLNVQFMPARHGMEILARRLADSRRAFPLGQLTAMFLSRPEALMVRLAPDQYSPPDETSTLTFFQCHACRVVYLDRDAVVNHILSAHLESYYQVEEENIEPPSGQFACVARCGLSGELIGPPNYHGYHERLTALHQARYAHMSFDAYRSRLEMCRDAETIAAWQQSMSRRAVYRPVTQPATTPEAEQSGETLTSLPAARQHFLQHRYVDAVLEGTSCVLPGTVARELDNERLRRCIEAAWRRESHAVMRTAITVRGMLRSLGFTAFKTADQQAYMTAIAPHSLGDVEVVESIRRILEFVDQHPRCERTALWKHLGLPTDTAAPAGAETRHFQWLVDKGHIIFFHDATLTLPHHLHSIRAPTHIRSRKRKKTGTAPRS